MRMGLVPTMLLLAVLMPAAATAAAREDGALVIRVTDARGAPVADAIVSVRPRAGAVAVAPRSPAARSTIDQKDLALQAMRGKSAPWGSVIQGATLKAALEVQ